MFTIVRRILPVLVCALAACQSHELARPGSATARTVQLPGVQLKVVEQGAGEPVVLVHGAFSDHRAWQGQQALLARSHRVIVPDQRYFGSQAWPDDGRQYALSTHVADLIALIEALKLGPVHLVGWSYGGAIVLTTAVQRPDLVKSLFVNEPSLGTIVTQAADLATLAEERKGLGSAVAASKANDQARAVRLFAEWVNATPGGFDQLSSELRSVFLDNARTLPMHFSSPPPPSVNCAQLGALRMPATVSKGEKTRRFFAILADTAHACMPASRLEVIARATHMAPAENPADFNASLQRHLAAR
ncbi:MAG: alpha/beta hydrolase [Burkholderiales bacterium]|nr:alpha/beta hydrolase [Burkholderiales bacterium]